MLYDLLRNSPRKCSYQRTRVDLFLKIPLITLSTAPRKGAQSINKKHTINLFQTYFSIHGLK